MSQTSEQDRILDHRYDDDIQEYDNPLPRWWLWIFYATIAFSALYLFNVIPGVGVGKGRIARYTGEVEAARARLAAATPPPVAITAESLVAADPARLALGKTTFTTNCTPCHREDGGGNIGPNLTDAYWIHGGKPLEILNTVSTGVPAKGMPAWSTLLKPDQLPAVAAYVLSLRATHPTNPKPPQGVEEEEPEASH
jgi:cytochrome c oxidase cbb3-type subunit 3